jgi:hypothetical protein
VYHGVPLVYTTWYLVHQNPPSDVTFPVIFYAIVHQFPRYYHALPNGRENCPPALQLPSVHQRACAAAERASRPRRDRTGRDLGRHTRTRRGRRRRTHPCDLTRLTLNVHSTRTHSNTRHRFIRACVLTSKHVERHSSSCVDAVARCAARLREIIRCWSAGRVLCGRYADW